MNIVQCGFQTAFKGNLKKKGSDLVSPRGYPGEDGALVLCKGWALLEVLTVLSKTGQRVSKKTNKLRKLPVKHKTDLNF